MWMHSSMSRLYNTSSKENYRKYKDKEKHSYSYFHPSIHPKKYILNMHIINTLCNQIIIDENELYVLLRFFLILISDFLDYYLSPFEVYFDEICFEFRSFFGNSFHRILLS